MADDDIGAAGIGEHRRAHVAGVRALRRGVAILPAELDLRAREDGPEREKQRRRRANHDIAAAITARRVAGERTGAREAVGMEAVHLPIGHEERSGRHERGLRLWECAPLPLYISAGGGRDQPALSRPGEDRARRTGQDGGVARS